MSITVHDNPTEHRYELVVDDQIAGVSYYELADEQVAFTHTEVDDAHTGQGLGKRLVAGMLADAEERGLAVVPQCPYVRKVIAEDAPRYLHLVPDHLHESFDLGQGM